MTSERVDQPLLNPVASLNDDSVQPVVNEAAPVHHSDSAASDDTTTSLEPPVTSNGGLGSVQTTTPGPTVVAVKNGASSSSSSPAQKKVSGSSSGSDSGNYYERLGEDGLEALELIPKEAGFLDQKSEKKEAIWNLVSTIIGGGILALPYVMAQAGLITAVVLFCAIGLLNVYTLQLLCDCGRAVRQNDMSLQRRIVTYVMVAEKSYPGNFLRRFVLISIFLFCYMTVLGYFVALADIIPEVIEDFRDVEKETDFVGGRTLAALCVLIVSFPLSLIRYIAKLWWLSLFAFLAIFILVLCVIASGFEVVLSSEYPNNLPDGAGDIVYARWDLELFSAISVITFAFTCHVNLFPVFSELKLSYSTDRKQTLLVGVWSVFTALLMYTVTGIFGYLQFRNTVKSNIVESLNDANDGENLDYFLLVGQIGLILMLIMSIILLGFPARRMMVLLIRGTADGTPLWVEGTISAFMLSSAFGLSLGFTQIGQIWSLAGALLGSLIAFTLPCLFYLKLEKNNQWFIDRDAKKATFVAALSLVLMIIGTEEAIREFVNDPPEF